MVPHMECGLRREQEIVSGDTLNPRSAKKVIQANKSWKIGNWNDFRKQCLSRPIHFLMIGLRLWSNVAKKLYEGKQSDHGFASVTKVLGQVIHAKLAQDRELASGFTFNTISAKEIIQAKMILTVGKGNLSPQLKRQSADGEQLTTCGLTSQNLDQMINGI